MNTDYIFDYAYSPIKKINNSQRIINPIIKKSIIIGYRFIKKELK